MLFGTGSSGFNPDGKKQDRLCLKPLEEAVTVATGTTRTLWAIRRDGSTMLAAGASGTIIRSTNRGAP
jgi:hypothetical protein